MSQFELFQPTFFDANALRSNLTAPLGSTVFSPPNASGIEASGFVFFGTATVNTPAPQTFTAVATTDIMTATAHGMHTGLVVQVSNSGGALPAGLSASTNYYVIRIDANTFYLATSLANTYAGTHIDLTTNGTGTQTITATALATASVYLQGSYDYGTAAIPTWVTVPFSTTTISATGSFNLSFPNVEFPNYRVFFTAASGQVTFSPIQIGYYGGN